ncbi:putative gustatory receptor 28b [Daphnia pulicaria]|uniref:putative gustatory receptor 28b n=1 Tax=Daphnia pulicaria TaxID=35523 RepID=UPI001EEA175D|nr:putative gustatory receptor 28b [Daphnia pulicaria]
MVEDMPSEYIPAVRKHVIAAILSPLIASISVLVSNPTIFNSKIQTAGLAFAVLNVISRCIMIVMVMGSFLLCYLCYYIVSCYIRLIILNLERPQRLPEVEMLVEKVSETRKTAWIPVMDTRKQKLKNSQRMFGYLCEALVEMNQAFSFPVLIFLTLRLISSAFSLYVAISGLLNANNLIFRALVPAFAMISIVGLFGILIVFRAADLPIIEMRGLRERIFSILNEEKDLDMDMELKAVAFLQDISEERVRLSAAGLFSVGMNVVPSLTAAIITYLIILLQTKLV